MEVPLNPTLGEPYKPEEPQIPGLILLAGPSGSGKTSLGRNLADTLHWRFLDADDFHEAEAKAKMARGQPLNDEDRRPWLHRLNDCLHEQRRQGQSAVLACSALKIRYRRVLDQGLRPPPLWFWLDLPPAELEHRLNSRTQHFFPASLLQTQLQAVEMSDELRLLPGLLPLSDLVQEVIRQMRPCLP